MRLSEILNESVTFGVARLENQDGRKVYNDPFQEQVMNKCFVCNGTGQDGHEGYIHPDTGENIPPKKWKCEMCFGKGELPEWKTTYNELNVANTNAMAIQEMLGIDPDYSGSIKHADLPEVRRRLIRLKNTDTSGYVQAPSTDVGKMRVSKDDDGTTRIGRGPTIHDAGRSHAQVERYIDSLLYLIDFAQKNNCDLVWG